MTINDEDFLYPSGDVQDLKAPDSAARLQSEFERIYAQLRKFRSEIDDLDEETATPSVDTHDLLSTTHPDTVVDDPQLGDLIVGGEASAVDVSKYFLDGHAFLGVPTATRGIGTAKYWLDGGVVIPMPNASGTISWRRLALGEAGTVLTSDGLQTNWEFPGAGAAASAIGASVYRSGNLLLADGVPVALTFDAEHYDDGALWDAAAPTRLTIPENGTYLILGTYTMAPAFGTGHAQAYLVVNGATEIARNSSAASNTAALSGVGQVACLRKLTAADYVEMYVVIEYPPGHILIGGSAATFLQIAKV